MKGLLERDDSGETCISEDQGQLILLSAFGSGDWEHWDRGTIGIIYGSLIPCLDGIIL